MADKIVPPTVVKGSYDGFPMGPTMEKSISSDLVDTKFYSRLDELTEDQQIDPIVAEGLKRLATQKLSSVCPFNYVTAGSINLYANITPDKNVRNLTQMNPEITKKVEDTKNGYFDQSNICVGPANVAFIVDADKISINPKKNIYCPFGKPILTPAGNYVCVANLSNL